MSTSNSIIFSKFLNNITDRSLVVNLDEYELNSILYQYLEESADLYFTSCLHDLSDRIDADYLRETVIADGNTDDFIISSFPATGYDEDSVSLYCTIDGIVSTTYTFTEATKTFSLTSAPTKDAVIELGFDNTGWFTDDLSKIEIQILVKGMILSWLSHYVNDENILKNKLTTKDYNAFSGANLLRELSGLQKQTQKDLKALINQYTYFDFLGFE